MLNGGRASDLILVLGRGVASACHVGSAGTPRAGLRWVARLVMLVLRDIFLQIFFLFLFSLLLPLTTPPPACILSCFLTQPAVSQRVVPLIHLYL